MFFESKIGSYRPDDDYFYLASPIVVFFITFVIFILLSECNSYPLFNQLTIRGRPTKYYVQARVDRHLNRMKQHYDAMEQLKNWRWDIDKSNEDEDATL
ncbi:unnamed protein product [Rotaria socialis]|uniref:Uncharacterized protein n=1 Tax=Rotaria socialis TaxID=392032 RepID=A0A818F2G1_9BILA|nr:unnamed protein product [Rotaria socialis]